VGEGQGGGCVLCRSRFANRFDHAHQIRKHLVVGETKHGITLRSEPSIAPSIGTLNRFEIMRLAIQFYDQSRGVAGEVGDIAAHRHLPPKAQTIEVMRLEIAPQQSLGARHGPAEGFRAVALSVIDGCVRHARSPPP
jgi:hypothetical protein